MFDGAGLENPSEIGLPVIEPERVGGIFGVSRQGLIIGHDVAGAGVQIIPVGEGSAEAAANHPAGRQVVGHVHASQFILQV